MRFRFTIRDLLWLIFLSAMAAGGWMYYAQLPKPMNADGLGLPAANAPPPPRPSQVEPPDRYDWKIIPPELRGS